MPCTAFLAFYVDPGSGSMVLQLLLGGVSGLYVVFRLFKQRILGLFGIHPEPARPAGQLLTPPAQEAEEKQLERPL